MSQFKKIKHIIKNQQLFNIVELNLFILLSFMMFFTLIAMTGFLRDFTVNELRYIFIIDLILLAFVVILLGRKVLLLWRSSRSGIAGARFNTKVAIAFGVLVAIPTILVTSFALIFLNLGMDGWFSKRVETALQESASIANSYLESNRMQITTDALKIMRVINSQGGIDVLISQENLQANITEQLLNSFLFIHDLTEALIINRAQQTIARAGLTFSIEFDNIADDIFTRANEQDVLLLENAGDDRVRAIARLDSVDELYLLIGRPSDSLVDDKIDIVAKAVGEYQLIRDARNDILLQLSLLYIMLTLMLVSIAIWIGLSYASKITHPLGELIKATDAIAQGDLTARVPNLNSRDEISALSRRFNVMGTQLQEQQDALIERQYFIENIIAGVNAGIISLDRNKSIILSNEAAFRVAKIDFMQHIGDYIGDLFPHFDHILNIDDVAQDFVDKEEEINIIINHQQHHIFVRLRAEKDQQNHWFYLLVFDDVTPLLSAQRKAAWVDVARIIAHEIKNPLTPIQLSAEILKRKFSKQISDDREKFNATIDTIMRQVKEIGGLIDGFSSFARMPAPTMASEDLLKIIDAAVLLQQSAHPHIDIIFDKKSQETLEFYCDEGQITRIFNNLIKNAIESIDEYHQGRIRGNILVTTIRQDNYIICQIEDNGAGFPVVDRHRLLDPYFTRKEMGTGLGLAIVKRIVEEHDGDIILGDASLGGALVKLIFKIT